MGQRPGSLVFRERSELKIQCIHLLAVFAYLLARP